jgi:hypothetical protein
VRLRDQCRSFRNCQYRGIYEKLDTSGLSFVQFHMLWNWHCKAGDVTCYEVVKSIMQELGARSLEGREVCRQPHALFQGLGSIA